MPRINSKRTIPRSTISNIQVPRAGDPLTASWAQAITESQVEDLGSGVSVGGSSGTAPPSKHVDPLLLITENTLDTMFGSGNTFEPNEAVAYSENFFPDGGFTQENELTMKIIDRWDGVNLGITRQEAGHGGGPCVATIMGPSYAKIQYPEYSGEDSDVYQYVIPVPDDPTTVMAAPYGNARILWSRKPEEPTGYCSPFTTDGYVNIGDACWWQFFKLEEDLHVCSSAEAYICDECGNQVTGPEDCKYKRTVWLAKLNCDDAAIPKDSVVIAFWFTCFKKWICINWEEGCPNFDEFTPQESQLVRIDSLKRIECAGVVEVLDGEDGPSEDCTRTRCVVDFVIDEKVYYDDDCSDHFCRYDTNQKHIFWTMPEYVLTCPESTEVVTQVLTEEKTISLGGYIQQTITINAQSLSATVVLDTPQPQNVTMTGTITGSAITLTGETERPITINGTVECEAELTTPVDQTVTSTGTVEGQTVMLDRSIEQTVTITGSVEGQTVTLGSDESRSVSGLSGTCTGSVNLGGFEEAEIELNGSTATANVTLDSPQPQTVSLSGELSGAQVTLGGMANSVGPVTGTCAGNVTLDMTNAISRPYGVTGFCAGFGELDTRDMTSKQYKVTGNCMGNVTLTPEDKHITLPVNLSGLVVNSNSTGPITATVSINIPVTRRSVITNIQIGNDGCTVIGERDDIWVLDLTNINPNGTYMQSLSADATVTIPNITTIGHVSGNASATGTVSIPEAGTFIGTITGKTETIKIPHRGSFSGTITGNTDVITIPNKGHFSGAINGFATVPVPTTGTLDGGSITATGTVNVPTSGSVTGLTIDGIGTVRVPTSATFTGGDVDFTSTGTVNVPTSATIEPQSFTSTGTVNVPTSATIEPRTVTSTGTVSIPTRADVICQVESSGTVNIPTGGTIDGEISLEGIVNVPTSGEINNLIVNGEGIVNVPTTVTITPETFDTTTETIEIYKRVACTCNGSEVSQTPDEGE